MLELNRIYCADSLELMKEIPDKSIDLVLTDPPYGIGRDKGFEGFEGFGGFGKPIARKRFEDDAWDSVRPCKGHFEEMFRVSQNAIIFGGNFFADILPPSTHWLVWDKLNTMPTFGDCELIYTNIKRNSVKKYTREYNGLIGKESQRFHPTQKPLRLLRDIILDYSNANDTILDPFLGSGTTALACLMENRNFIGIEREQKYCDIAEKRIDLYKRQGKLELE